jgi:hypothetical protein
MSVRALVSFLLLLGIQVAQAEPAPIEMPDVRANVMEMLRQGREQGTATVIETGPAAVDERPVGGDTLQGADREPATVEDLFEQARRQQQERQDDTSEPKAKPTPVVEPPAEPADTATSVNRSGHEHLSLPNKVITIHDLQDIQQLSDEFDQAKRRKPER